MAFAVPSITLPTMSQSQRRILAVKHRVKAEYTDVEWCASEYHKIFSNWSKTFTADNRNMDDIWRAEGSELTVTEFKERYESQSRPVILSGMTESWPASNKWTVDKLLKKYSNQKFKVGVDNDGHSVRLKMKYFVDYMRGTTDDSPFFISDSSFGERAIIKDLLKDYEVPNLFADDLLKYAGKDHRPPNRWFSMASPRSGDGIQLDWGGRNTWSALLQGCKKWCLFPPKTPRSAVEPKKDTVGIYADEAITWFVAVYPKIRSPGWLYEWTPIEAIQRPGDIIFIPSGWWYISLNITETISVTQKFCTALSLPLVYLKTLGEKPAFCKYWFKCLEKARPEVLPITGRSLRCAGDLTNLARASDDSSSSTGTSTDSDSDDSDSSLESLRLTWSNNARIRNGLLSGKRKAEGWKHRPAKVRHRSK